MPEKSRPFSIYLLKAGFDATNSLNDDHNLRIGDVGAELPAGSVLYILDAARKRPWWREYFGVQDDIWQEFKGALLFLPVQDRWFGLSFGQVYHHLKDNAYEYDFGLKVTLNMLDPKELRSADMVEPGPARRKRTQVPVSTELTYLDFDCNSEIIKSLTGKVKREHRDLFRNATGSSSLKVSLKLQPSDLPSRCETLLDLYNSDDYEESFPNIQNIAPIRDPDETAQLNDLLLEAVRQRDGRVTLSIPDIVDYKDNTCCVFVGGGETSDIYPDITLDKLYEFVGDEDRIQALTIADLTTYRMVLTDLDGTMGRSYSVFRSLIFDVEPEGEAVICHLCDGDWYKVEAGFAERLRHYIDGKCERTDLLPYDHDVNIQGKAAYSEERYNEAMAASQPRLICLDQTDISPAGSTAIEPCDLYRAEADATAGGGHRGYFYHVKISTRSSHLSHLFNQGVNSIELIQLEPTSCNKMKELIVANLNGNDAAAYLAPFEHFDFKVVFGVITHKAAAGRSANLPLFSKLSLMRNMQRLDLMKVPSALTFIQDLSPAKDGQPRYESLVVEVFDVANSKEVRVVPGQGIDSTIPIRNCPKAVRDNAAGTRFTLSVKRRQDGTLSSYHGWPYEIIAQELAE